MVLISPFTRLYAFATAVLVALALAACGGGSNNGNPGSSGGNSGGTTPVNPCSTALEADQISASAGVVAGGAAAPVSNKKTLIDGDPRGRVFEALWINR